MRVQRVPQLHELDVVDVVGVGHHVYSQTRKTSREYPIGGLVWRVEPYAEQGTGEARRRFHVIRGDDGLWVFDTVDSNDVDVEALHPPRNDLIRDAICVTLPRQLMRMNKKKWKRDHQQLVVAMYALSKVLVPHG